LSKINKLHEDVGTMDVSSLISEKVANRKKAEGLLVEVILFRFVLNNLQIPNKYFFRKTNPLVENKSWRISLVKSQKS